FVMSDSEDSTVTYTSISSDDGSSDVGSPGVIEPPPPDFVPEPIYPEFMPPEDDVLLDEEQPLPVTVSPTADSSGYITESDPEEDPKEDDEDPEEDLTDYPTKIDDEEEEDESFGDDTDDDEEEEDEDEEEEDHLASTNSVPPPAYRTTARMSIRDQTPIPFPSEEEVDRLLTISTPPSSPLTSYSSPLPQIPSPPLPVSSPLPMSPPPLPASPTYPLGYIAAMIQLRDESPLTSHPILLPPPIVLPHTKASMSMMRAATPSTYILTSRSETPPLGTPPLLPIPLPTSSPPLLLPYTDCRVDVLEEDPDEIAEEIPATDVAELGSRMANFVMTVRQDTDEIYGRLDDVQDDRSLISSQLNLLHRDRHAHARTTILMESEARASREAWVQSMDAIAAHRGTDSANDIADSDGSITKSADTC
ncbi:hypothetical protein Tco_1497233, partial [Tanacetum coccineum]